MLEVLAVANYRSLLKLVIPLGQLNVISGANGSGKSNLYRALRLLAETQRGGVVRALAREGGLASTLWAGPEELSRRMRRGDVPIEGGPRRHAVRMHLGFASQNFGYALSLGLPKPSNSAFALDPEIKREAIWAGPFLRPASLLIDRRGSVVRAREGRGWRLLTEDISAFDGLLSEVSDPQGAPEVWRLRQAIRGWRFYDHFRTDAEAPARLPQLATRTPVLHADGRDLAAALQTIREIGDGEALDLAVAEAFPGSKIELRRRDDGRLVLELAQTGLLRPLAVHELSDGTLRYLLWVAALLTPRPPALMVLNEPESSLHEELLPPLAGLIAKASEKTRVWVVSHARILLDSLHRQPGCQRIELEKDLGQTLLRGQRPLEAPPWHWPD